MHYIILQKQNLLSLFIEHKLNLLILDCWAGSGHHHYRIHHLLAVLYMVTKQNPRLLLVSAKENITWTLTPKKVYIENLPSLLEDLLPSKIHQDMDYKKVQIIQPEFTVKYNATAQQENTHSHNEENGCEQDWKAVFFSFVWTTGSIQIHTSPLCGSSRNIDLWLAESC